MILVVYNANGNEDRYENTDGRIWDYEIGGKGELDIFVNPQNFIVRTYSPLGYMWVEWILEEGEDYPEVKETVQIAEAVQPGDGIMIDFPPGGFNDKL